VAAYTIKNTDSAYTIKNTDSAPSLTGDWDGEMWGAANTLRIETFHAKSAAFHPRTHVRLLHGADCLYVHFRVQDRYLLALAESNQGAVWRDSCVEFFVRPKADQGYFNFEINAGGKILLYHIRDWTHVKGGFKDFEKLPEEWLGKIKLYHSAPERIPVEQVGDCVWQIEYRIPKALFEAYVGPLGDLSGQTWQANFYKCAAGINPHYGMWSGVGETLDFHQPGRFLPVDLE
jgi:hypothetical protein